MWAEKCKASLPLFMKKVDFKDRSEPSRLNLWFVRKRFAQKFRNKLGL